MYTIMKGISKETMGTWLNCHIIMIMCTCVKCSVRKHLISIPSQTIYIEWMTRIFCRQFPPWSNGVYRQLQHKEACWFDTIWWLFLKFRHYNKHCLMWHYGINIWHFETYPPLTSNCKGVFSRSCCLLLFIVSGFQSFTISFIPLCLASELSTIYV